jgi:hypothetical protein
MPRIARPSVRPNLATISNLGLAALRVGSPFAGMAIPTQALQRAQQEAVPVAVMRLDMVGDCGGDDMAMLATDPAQGLEPKLMLRSLAPALQRIRISPGRCLRGSGRKLGQEAKRRCHEAFGRFALCRRRVVSGFRAGDFFSCLPILSMLLSRSTGRRCFPILATMVLQPAFASIASIASAATGTTTCRPSSVTNT